MSTVKSADGEICNVEGSYGFVELKFLEDYMGDGEFNVILDARTALQLARKILKAAEAEIDN